MDNFANTEVKRGLRIEWKLEHRSNICEVCGVKMEPRETTIQARNFDKTEPRVAMRPFCPECGGSKGVLISRGVSVHPPSIPNCLSFRCLFKYFRDSIFCVLLSSYHIRRVYYAESNRNKKILERYRIGEPSPQTIWQAIHANIKLKCPICRKYNVDPFLFRNK